MVEKEIEKAKKSKEVVAEEKKVDTGKKEKVEEKKVDAKEEKKQGKKVKKEIEKKDKAIVNVKGLRISTKFSVSIFKMIYKKSLDKAIELLDSVIKERTAVRMASSEAPHQKSRGMRNISGARFPKKAATEIKELIKQLKANCVVNGIEEPIIVIAKADNASRPFKSGGRKAKRTNVYIEARTKTKLNKK